MNDETDQDVTSSFDELAMLKQRAKLMGVTHSNNISLEKLREKVAAKMAGEPEVIEAAASQVNPLDTDTPAQKKETLRQKLYREQMKLVRLRITNMDPKKKDLPGEIFAIGNKYLGTIRKYIPYGEVTDNGYHVPYCLYKELDSRKFLNIRTSQGRNGQDQVSATWAKEFALEVLPPLTKEELARLATAQAAAGVFGTEAAI